MSRIKRIMQLALKDEKWQKVIVEPVAFESMELPLQTVYDHQEPLVSTELSYKQLEKSSVPSSGTSITAAHVEPTVATNLTQPVGSSQLSIQAEYVTQKAVISSRDPGQLKKPSVAGPSCMTRTGKLVLDDSSQDSSEEDPYSSSGSSYKPAESEAETEDENPSGEVEPIPKKRKRRKANKTLWKRGIVKHLRLSGKKYVNRSGKEVDEKKPKLVDCSKCRFKCNSFFPEEERELICKEYYALADYRRQKIDLCSLIKNTVARRRKIKQKVGVLPESTI